MILAEDVPGAALFAKLFDECRTSSKDSNVLLVKEVRPHRVVTFKEVCEGLATDDFLLVHGVGMDVVPYFEMVAKKLSYGSAVAVFDVATVEQIETLSAHAALVGLRDWSPGGVPDGGRAWVKSHGGGGYGTHSGILSEAVRRTRGDVLELGAGDFSTPELHKMLLGTGRYIVTVDNNEEWVSKFKHLEMEGHKIEVEADPAATHHLDDFWSVVFIDHAPGETRKAALERVRGKAQYIVVHDTEERGYELEEGLCKFKYRKDFRYARPWTTVVSDVFKVW